MSYLKKIHPGKVFATAVIVMGSFSMVKLFQESRFMKKDLNVLSKSQLNERDLERVKEKYKFSALDIESLKKAKKLRKTAMVENVIEKDPNFEHKRAEGMD
ncbi:uncharacterized protein LOC132719920 [Ruditapes philippinarum]|uniref:uncharacterized protein LOC132719920 n=1 Tax=Ruditapes philippinarum TaxID=129788 RepID=UPI00295AEC7A|nr:uncharacterized protein LOC132719920 [Ruditapes philippinarum]